MSNLFLLFKKDFLILLGSLQGKKKRKSTISATGLLVLGVIAIIALYSYQAWTMFDGLGQMGLGKLCVFHACITTLSVMVIVGTMRVSTSSQSNDSDLLLSLPIKKRDIVISKSISKYLFDLFFTVMLFLPYVIIYQIRAEYNLLALILGLLVTFILPLLSIGISYILDFIINRIYAKTKFSNLLKSSTLVIIFVMVMGLMLTKTSTYGTVQFDSMEAYFAERPISNLLLKFMFETNVVNTLIVLLMTIVPFVVGLTVFAIDYGKPVLTYHSKGGELKFKSPKSAFGLLYKKEMYGYVTNPAYFINTIIGPIGMLVISIFLAITGKDGLMGLFEIPEFDSIYISAILAIVFCFMSGMTAISASSVSLEGKNVWLLKSSPVNVKQLLNAKSLTHITIVEPFVIVSAIITGIVFKFSLLSFGILLVLPTLHVLISAYCGLLINLWVPKMEWDNDIKVIKQSLSVTLALVMGIVFALLPLGAFLLFDNLSFEMLFLISSGLYLFILIIILIILKCVANKLFNKL